MRPTPANPEPMPNRRSINRLPSTKFISDQAAKPKAKRIEAKMKTIWKAFNDMRSVSAQVSRRVRDVLGRGVFRAQWHLAARPDDQIHHGGKEKNRGGHHGVDGPLLRDEVHEEARHQRGFDS